VKITGRLLRLRVLDDSSVYGINAEE